MAGYFLYTIDHAVFSQLTTSPTRAQGLALAEIICEEFDDYLEQFDDVEAVAMWPNDRDALADLIVQRLALEDWYSDLSYDNANMWDNVIDLLREEPGEAIGIDFQCSDYESIYWDCAEIATEHGATMMAEPTFGSSAFRYFGKPASEYSVYPMYSLFEPEQTKVLLKQLESVESHFASLPAGEGSPHEQFFEGLLPSARHAVAQGRVLWVQTDT